MGVYNTCTHCIGEAFGIVLKWVQTLGRRLPRWWLGTRLLKPLVSCEARTAVTLTFAERFPDNPAKPSLDCTVVYDLCASLLSPQ